MMAFLLCGVLAVPFCGCGGDAAPTIENNVNEAADDAMDAAGGAEEAADDALNAATGDE